MSAEEASSQPRSPANEQRPWIDVRGPTLICLGSWIIGVISIGLAIVATDRYRRAVAADISPDRAFIVLLLATLAAVLSLAVAHCRPELGQVRRQVATSAIWSVTLVLALAVVWSHINLAVRDVERDAAIGPTVLDEGEVDAYLSAHRGPHDAADPRPYRIPTGVLLESVEFLSANNVRVSGLVWQKWPPGIPADITRGIALPEAIEVADLDGPAYQATQADGTELIGWRLRATIRQAFDYHRYPFDRQDVWLRLWPRDLGRRVVLVPDFASYPDITPTALPGLDQQFVYGGWTPEHAHFTYGATRYDATLGFDTPREATAYPVLYFNVGLKREFLEPFLDYVVFALVVAILLFAVLVLSMNARDGGGGAGLSTFSVLGLAGTLLFAVILREFQLRSSLDPDQIVYLEALPLLLNLAILVVALLAIIGAEPFCAGGAPPLPRNPLVPVLLYWPVLLGALLVVTLVVFYR